jgi:hypothetical protein
MLQFKYCSTQANVTLCNIYLDFETQQKQMLYYVTSQKIMMFNRKKIYFLLYFIPFHCIMLHF